jgi:hypothetical protein
MLRFQTPPDRPFMAIITRSIGVMIEQIDEFVREAAHEEEAKDNFQWLLPNASQVFHPETALNMLRKLLVCHQKPAVYHLNDYHYLLLYDTLEHFCVIHNDMIKMLSSKERDEHSMIGSFYIEMVRFGDIVDTYFFDTDFLSDPDTMLELGMDGRRELHMNNETFAISQRFAPHPEELEMKEHPQEKAVIREPSDLFGPTSRVYPDFR